ncbi:P-loop containing nucleoside triphosphate hydrolase protein [Lindgomyces ingoldianus]|uniref:P-loop containing nucleoside triphosphate hydrolase protein n=1 Tax=Lindgomyces ingoldianus TaxID=673940 RepID=A0ACB6R3C7_9PLEO|nr:P-loop containing nucleoside triphosphate hydrolase protein [Lindgomyces ingoldianus]KAF2473754.1 P-loop containing nucleoside triphosphate hydrolase protein [Lindgomyces ingoldianus]
MADEEDALETPLNAALYKPPTLLPIARLKDVLLYTIETYPLTIIVGETGSGKTTQIPQFLYKSGWTADGTSIAITQPRRVAVTTVAARVAHEMGCELGQEVGYSIRFDDVTSEKTRIKFLTDGMLLREILVDPLLKRYSVIMVDEAHERSLSSDILLGLLTKIMKKRHDLRVVVSSATLDAEHFLEFFTADVDEKIHGKKKEEYGYVIGIEGRMHHVDLHYLIEPTPDYLERTVETILEIHTSEPDGDILVFLTGRDEIETTIDMIQDRLGDLDSKFRNIQSLPLYAGLSSDQQMYVFEPAPEKTRKVIISTNIAEASVTIDGIVYVIDCGFVKLRSYDPTSGIERLSIAPISKASAIQRAGRAGRTRPGKCYRLYTEEDYEDLEDVTPPEIQRSNLAPVFLQLFNLGITNVVRFPYVSNPPSKLATRALELLYALGALDDLARITKPLGIRMAELPLEPMLAKALLNATSFNCLSEMLSIAAMMTLQGTTFVLPEGEKKQADSAKRKFAVDEGDHITLFNVYDAFIGPGRKDPKWCRDNYLNFKALEKAVSVRKQLARHLDHLGIQESAFSGSDVRRVGGVSSLELTERIQRCLTTGFFAHAARMKPDGSFTTVDGGTTLWAHPSSLFFHRKADWVIYTEILESKDKIFIRDITSIDKDWLLEYAPEYYKVKKR